MPCRSKFSLVFQIYLTISLLTISVTMLYFGPKEIAEDGQFSHIFLPYWMCCVAALLILEQMISWRVFVKNDNGFLPIFDVLLAVGIFLITLLGVFMLLVSAIASAGGIIPPIIGYGVTLGVLTVVVYASRFLKFLVTKLCECTHNQGQPVYLNF